MLYLQAYHFWHTFLIRACSLALRRRNSDDVAFKSPCYFENAWNHIIQCRLDVDASSYLQEDSTAPLRHVVYFAFPVTRVIFLGVGISLISDTYQRKRCAAHPVLYNANVAVSPALVGNMVSETQYKKKKKIGSAGIGVAVED